MTDKPRALISVSDKTGIEAFAKRLTEMNFEIVSTGGTANALRNAGLDIRDVSEITEFPEMMDGRIKTLHPRVHGGLLSLRDKAGHIEAMKSHEIGAIDLLVVNLYPFEETLRGGGDFAACIENIDIGGPAMIRAAAKNHQFVCVVTDPEDYEEVADALSENAVTAEMRRRFAAKAFSMTAAYDSAISGWLNDVNGEKSPRHVSFSGRLAQTLRYGENPHQASALYLTGEPRFGVATAEQVQGKALSYNNLNDTDAAYELIADLGVERPAVAIIKHANPCGVAYGETLLDAYEKALRCDPVSAFGGIIALNQALTGEVAERIIKTFTEVVIAPSADEGARSVFAKKKNLRLLVAGGVPEEGDVGAIVRPIAGGMLVQDRDVRLVTKADLNIVTKRQPSEDEIADMLFAFRVAKHVKSNAIVYAKNGATVGVGAGQMSRLDSSRIAARKAIDAAEAAGQSEPLTVGSVVASDAFFPFADGMLAAVEAGARAVIQPGGSIRDEEIIAAADEAGLAMALTGVRHFRH